MLDCRGSRAKHCTEPREHTQTAAYRPPTLRNHGCPNEIYYTQVTRAIGPGITCAGGGNKPRDSRRSHFPPHANAAQETASCPSSPGHYPTQSHRDKQVRETLEKKGKGSGLSAENNGVFSPRQSESASVHQTAAVAQGERSAAPPGKLQPPRLTKLALLEVFSVYGRAEKHLSVKMCFHTKK